MSELSLLAFERLVPLFLKAVFLQQDFRDMFLSPWLFVVGTLCVRGLGGDDDILCGLKGVTVNGNDLSYVCRGCWGAKAPAVAKG